MNAQYLDSHPSDHGQDESHNHSDAGADSSRSQEVNDALDGGVGTVIGGFEPTIGTVMRVRPVMEAAIGERPAEALMEEQEEQGDLDALG